MALKTPAIDGEMCDMLALARRQVEETLKALAQAQRELDTCASAAAADIRKDARQLTAAILVLGNEKKKIDDTIKEFEGLETGYALDLDAARAEIRRRLACLRNARNSGELSE